MRIGLDARMYGKNQSGIGAYIEQIAGRLFLLDQENDYFIFLREPFFSKYRPTHEKIHKVKADYPWYSLAEQTKFLFLLLRYKLDLMHFPHFNAPIFYPGKRITTIHDITPYFFPGPNQKRWHRKKAYDLVFKASLRKSEIILASSRHTKDDLARHFHLPAQKISVCYLGIDRRFSLDKNYAKIKEIKERCKISKPYIFFLSAHLEHKNFLGLISAFEIIKNQYGFDCQLVLGGKINPDYPDIEKRISQSPFKNDIIAPGFISDNDLPSFYQGAEVFCLPSFYEGFGLIGLEAMASGIPVISSNATCLPEILGDAALYFDPHNEKEMAEKIYQVLTEPQSKDQLIAKGLKQIKKYSWDACAAQILQAYQKILQ